MVKQTPKKTIKETSQSKKKDAFKDQQKEKEKPKTKKKRVDAINNEVDRNNEVDHESIETGSSSDNNLRRELGHVDLTQQESKLYRDLRKVMIAYQRECNM